MTVHIPQSLAREALVTLNTMAEGYIALKFSNDPSMDAESEAWNKRKEARIDLRAVIDERDALKAQVEALSAENERQRKALEAIVVVGSLFVGRGGATARCFRGLENGPDEHSHLVRRSDVLAALNPAKEG